MEPALDATPLADAVPPISVIIPTRNEAAFIRSCLDSIINALAALGGGEVLVVDGRSGDGTAAIVREYQSWHPGIRLLENEQRVTPVAFNLGLRHARSAMISIISAHSRVDLDFFTAAVHRLETDGIAIVGGPVRTEPGSEGRLAWLLAQVVSHPFGVGNSRFRVSERAGDVDAVPFGVFRREVFDRVGVFDTTLVRNQDTEFFGRVARAGLRVYLDPAVRSVYRARGTLGALLLQGFRNAYWNVLVWTRNPTAFQWRHAVPGLFVLSLISGLVLALFFPIGGELLRFELGAYACAAIIAAVQIAIRRRRPMALLLPPLFLVYHLVYGSGSLIGLMWLFRRYRADRAH